MRGKDKRVLSTGEAIREGIAELGKTRNDVVLLAEGLSDPSSVYGTTEGLAEFYPPSRMVEMPVSENGLCGVAVGAALTGKRPLISLHRVEFALLALEQIFNNAAKAHYVSNGQHMVPLVIRAVIGRGWGQGPEHSQSLETLFAYIPGLKVLMPTFPADAKGMIIAAVEDNNPVIVLEHRWCHYVKGEVEEGYYLSDLTAPKKIRSGSDYTVVTSSYMTIEAMQACEQLERYGISVDLFDLRVARPLNVDAIKHSVQSTKRLLTVDLGYRTLGIGSEIVSQIVESGIIDLACPPVRLGLPDHPVPSSVGFIDGLYVDAERIFKSVAEAMELPEHDIQAGGKSLRDKRNMLPLDVPDPSFNGPF